MATSAWAADSGKAGPRIALIQGSIDVELENDSPGRQQMQIFKEYCDLSQQARAERSPRRT